MVEWLLLVEVAGITPTGISSHLLKDGYMVDWLLLVEVPEITPT
jgi:hypothetical protein